MGFTPTRTFGINLPYGRGQDDVPALLEHAARALRELDVRTEDVMNISYVYGDTTDDGGLLPGLMITIAVDEQAQREQR